MRSKAFALLFLGSAISFACRTTGPAPPPPGPGPGVGISNAPPNPNPMPVTPPPMPEPTPPAPQAQAAYAPAPAPPPAPALSEPAFAPSPAAAVPEQTSAAPPRSASAGRPHEDILKLKQAGFTDEFLLNKIRAENIDYQLTTPEILELRAAGLSEQVLEAMLRAGRPPAASAGAPVARKAEFAGLARVGRSFLGVFGTSTKDVGRLVVDGETVAWFQSHDPEENFSVYAKNIKEIFNTCVLRPGQNLCLEFGFVTFTGEEHRFRDPGWKSGENRLVTEATAYFRQAFPNLFFSQREESKL